MSVSSESGFGKKVSRYLDFVSKHFRWIFMSYLLLMGFFAYQSFFIKLDSNLYSLFPDNLKSMKNIDKMQSYYGGTGNLTVSVKIKHPNQMLLSLIPQYIDSHNNYIQDLQKIVNSNPDTLSNEQTRQVNRAYKNYLKDMEEYYLPPLYRDIKENPEQDKKYTQLFLKEYQDIIKPDLDSKYQAFNKEPSIKTINLLLEGFNNNIITAELYNDTIAKTLPADRAKILQNFSTLFAKNLSANPDIIFVDYMFNQKFVEDHLLYFLDQSDISYINTQLQNRINYERRKSLLSSFIFVDENDSDLNFQFLKDKYVRMRGVGVSRKFIRLQNPTEVLDGKNQGLTQQYYFSKSKDTILLNIRASQGPSNINYSLYLLDVIKKNFEATQKNKSEFNILQYYSAGPYVDREVDAKTLSQDLSHVTPIVLMVVCCIIAFYFRSFIAVFIVCSPLLSELLFALGFVKIFYGYLNIVSSFLVAIMSGMGVNFGTHLLSRYVEAKKRGKNPRDAMQEVYTTIFLSNITATLTTAGGFFVLALSSFKGFREFGIIAGIAMISLLVGIIVAFPSFVFWLEKYNLVKIRSKKNKSVERLRGKKFPVYKLLCLCGLGMFLFSIFSLSKVEFNSNFASLVHKKDSLRSTELYYEKENNQILKIFSATGITPIYVPDLKTYKELTHFLLTSRFANEGFRMESLFIYDPDDQKQKQKEMAKLQKTLKSDLLNSNNDETIKSKLDFVSRISKAKPINLVDIPESLKSLFKGIKPGYFILYYSTQSLGNVSKVMNYHKDFELLDEKFGDQGVFLASDIWIFGDLIQSLKKESWVLFFTLLLTLSTLLYLDFRSLRLVIGSLIPLMIGMIFMTGFCVIFNIELNFFNVLMLPAIAGLGIDYGVHILHRIREEGKNNLFFVFATTGRTMWIAATQDMTGFAILLIALYHGLVSTGALLLSGALGCLIVGSILLPAFIEWEQDIKKNGFKKSLFSKEGYWF